MNPLDAIFQSFQRIANGIQIQLSSFTASANHPSSSNEKPLLSQSPFSNSSSSHSIDVSIKGKASQPVTREELGRSTWTFLHTLAAQYPEHPTRQQKKDVKELMAILSRMYPCKECADHFKEVLRSNPVQTGSQVEFSQWLCHVHNVVNRRVHRLNFVLLDAPTSNLGKPTFPCERVDARWGKLDCEQRLCDLQGTTSFGDDTL